MSPSAPARVLLVESDPIERLLVRSGIGLRGAPLRLREATELEVALQLLRHEKYDLVLVGRAGDLPASEAAAALRAACGGTPVILHDPRVPPRPELLLESIRAAA